MRTRVANLRDIAWQDGDIYCGRGTPYGNRYSNGKRSKASAIALHRSWFYDAAQAAFRDRVKRELTGHRLICHCHPEPCHCDTYAEFCDAEEASEVRADL